MPGDSPPDDALIFDLDRFDVAVNLRRATLSVPDGRAMGFLGATTLADSTLVAHGFDIDRSSGSADLDALWTSNDGYEWERVDQAIGDRPAQIQSLPDLVSHPDGRVIAPIAVVAPGLQGSAEGTDYGLAVSWSTADGQKWGSDALIGNALITNGTAVDGGVVLAGVADPNSDAFTAAFYSEPTGGGNWSESLLEPNGEPSVVNDMAVVGGTLVAVGATARTDPIASVGTELDELLGGSGPSDVAVWRSTDATTWEPVETDAFTAKTGPAQAHHVVNVEDKLYTLVSEVIAYQTVLGLYASSDTGLTWERVRIPRAIAGNVGNGTNLGAVGLYVAAGALVIIEGRTGASERLFMTIVDPTTGDADIHEVSTELGLDAMTDIVAFDNVSLGFGYALNTNFEPTPQTVEIRLVDSSASAPSPTSVPPVPASTTAVSPPPGASESVAPIEPVDPELDPLGYQRVRPLRPLALNPQWTIDSPGFVVRGAAATDEVVVYSMIETGNVHHVYAVDRDTGEPLWSVARDRQRVMHMQFVADVLVIDWSQDDDDSSAGYENPAETRGYDPLSGEEIWFVPDTDRVGTPPDSSNHITRGLPDTFDNVVIDPQSGTALGTVLPVGHSFRGLATGRGQDLVEVDPATLAPVGEPVPIGQELRLRSDLVALANYIAIPYASSLDIVDRNGDLITQFEFSRDGAWGLTPVSPSSDVVIVHLADQVAAVDAATLNIDWVMEADGVQWFGDVNGETHAVMAHATSTDFVALESGEVRCTLDGVRSPELLRDGFRVGTKIYDADCRPALVLAGEADLTIDRGVITAVKIEDRVQITLLE